MLLMAGRCIGVTNMFFYKLRPPSLAKAQTDKENHVLCQVSNTTVRIKSIYIEHIICYTYSE